MLKKLLLIGLAVILLVLPVAIRWLYYYEGRYQPQAVARPDLTQVQVPTAQAKSFEDSFSATAAGTILVDLAHSNRFTMTELNVLQSRLAARGQRIELLKAAEDLPKQLRYAQALIVISPGEDWTASQIQEVQDFVDKGGRLLLVADPTRYGVRYDELENPILDEDVPHLNTLAGQFGLLFQPDYLYNTSDNAGNFRNIRLTGLAEHALTQGVEQIVFYATHSISSEEPALIAAGGETRSSDTSEARATGALPVAVLASEGKVLALGDLTFMAEPYNAEYDNDRLIANIADFLSGALRQYDLADFPYFFADQADLVYAGAPLLDSDLLKGVSALQALFAGEGKELTVRETEDESSDTLFFGLYDTAEEVEPYLEAAQVTLLITPTVATAGGEEEGEETPRAGATPEGGTPAATPEPQATEPTPAATEPEPESPEATQPSPPAVNRVRIESMGEMVVTGTLLLVLESDGQRQVMVMLADTEKGLGSGIERLTKGELTGCVLDEAQTPEDATVVLCPTGEAAAGGGAGGWETPEEEAPAPGATGTATKTVTPAGTPEPAGEAAGKILIVALDKGEGAYDGMTSADEYATILRADYDVTVWSQAREGLPQVRDMREYDLVIWTAGDFKEPLGEEESNLVFLVMLEGVPVVLSGAYISGAETQSVQRDIQVKDPTHPMARGFKSGEVIAFDAAPSGSEYETDLLDDVQETNQVVVFVRGPNSDDAGSPSIYAFEEEVSGVRVAFIGLPLYLLPDQARSRLVLNAVEWLLS